MTEQKNTNCKKSGLILLSVLFIGLAALCFFRYKSINNQAASNDTMIKLRISHDQTKDTYFELVGQTKDTTEPIAKGFILKDMPYSEDIIFREDKNNPIRLILLTNEDSHIIYDALEKEVQK